MAALTLSHLQKSFGATAVLNDVSLEIRDGEFISLVGPSGCGKTTLLRIIAGLDHADSGQVRIGEQAVDALPPKARDVAMVFQSYALYPYMTVRENMALPLVMRRLSWLQRLPLLGHLIAGRRALLQDIRGAVADVAASLGLAALLDRRPAQLSGGQRQRVALGRAMVRQPQVFLMDEPLSNLDAKLRVATRAEIAQLHRRLGTTFVYVTHDQVEAMTMSDRVALMIDGRVLQVATPQQIYDDPADLRVAEFIGTPRINALRATRTEGGLRVAGQRWSLQVGGDDGAPLRVGAEDDAPLREGAEDDAPLRVAVRPEWWTLHGDGAHAGEQPAIVRGTLVHQELLGAETLLHVGLPDEDTVLIARVEPERARGLALGAPMLLSTQRVLVFDAQGRRLRDVQWLPQRHLEVVNG